MKILIVLFSAFLFVNANAQKLSKIPVASNNTYGYKPENPLTINRDNPGKAFDYFMNLIDNLSTMDDQSLVLLNHSTYKDANYKRPNPLVRSYDKGLFKNSKYGVSGMIEKYQFLTENSKDTIILFVDFNTRGPLRIPVNLKLKAS